MNLYIFLLNDTLALVPLHRDSLSLPLARSAAEVEAGQFCGDAAHHIVWSNIEFGS